MLQKKSGYSRENTNQKGSLRHIEKEEGRKRKGKANVAYNELGFEPFTTPDCCRKHVTISAIADMLLYSITCSHRICRCFL